MEKGASGLPLKWSLHSKQAVVWSHGDWGWGCKADPDLEGLLILYVNNHGSQRSSPMLLAAFTTRSKEMSLPEITCYNKVVGSVAGEGFICLERSLAQEMLKNIC